VPTLRYAMLARGRVGVTGWAARPEALVQLTWDVCDVVVAGGATNRSRGAGEINWTSPRLGRYREDRPSSPAAEGQGVETSWAMFSAARAECHNLITFLETESGDRESSTVEVSSQKPATLTGTKSFIDKRRRPRPG